MIHFFHEILYLLTLINYQDFNEEILYRDFLKHIRIEIKLYISNSFIFPLFTKNSYIFINSLNVYNSFIFKFKELSKLVI